MDFDARHAILLAINILKMSRDWDPYNTINNLTWIQIVLFVVFPFIYFKVHVPLTTHVAHSSITSTTIPVVLRQFEKLCAPLAVTLMAAVLILPQAIFWYVYPIIILIPSCVLNRFANWLHTVLISIPVLTVELRATTVRWQIAFGPEPDHNEASEGDTQGPEMRLVEATEDLEAGRATV